MRLEIFEDWHVWLNLKTAELEVLHVEDCPLDTGLVPYQFTDYEYLGAL